MQSAKKPIFESSSIERAGNLANEGRFMDDVVTQLTVKIHPVCVNGDVVPGYSVDGVLCLAPVDALNLVEDRISTMREKCVKQIKDSIEEERHG